jgi:hypothetical protein
MWFDRTLFPHCPTCGKVIRICTRPQGVARTCSDCGSPRVFPPKTGAATAIWWFVFTLGPMVWASCLLLYVLLSPVVWVLEAYTGVPSAEFMARQWAALWYWFWVFITLGVLTTPERDR